MIDKVLFNYFRPLVWYSLSLIILITSGSLGVMLALSTFFMQLSIGEEIQV